MEEPKSVYTVHQKLTGEFFSKTELVRLGVVLCDCVIINLLAPELFSFYFSTPCI